MGISNDAQLMFGINLGDEAPDFLDYTDEEGHTYKSMEDFIYKECGIVDNKVTPDGFWEFCRNRSLSEMERDMAPEYKEYDVHLKNQWDKEKKAVEKYPVKLIRYCSWDYPMYILAPNVKEAEITGWRGNATVVEEWPKVPKKAVKRFKQWCLDHDIEYTEPKWYLDSMNG